MILYRALQVGKTCVCEIKKKFMPEVGAWSPNVFDFTVVFFKAHFPEDW